MGLTRRTMLTGTGSLAMAIGPRKSRAQDVAVGQLLVNDPPRPLPGLRWTDADGKPRSLADHAGSGVILNFWATWCQPCVAELPSLATLAQALVPHGIITVPISTDTDGARVVPRFYAAHHITGLGTWLDPDGVGSRAAGVVGLPTSLIIDRQGREAARIAGGANWGAPGTAETIQALCAL